MLRKKLSIRLKRDRLDTSLKNIRDFGLPAPPKKGWIREIREALGMSRTAFARRLSLDPSTVLRLENSEAKRTITLASLERLARALECDVSYVLVPKRSLFEMLKERAERVLAKDEKEVEHTMQLEGQGSGTQSNVRHAYEVASLIESSDKRLWEDEEEK